MRLLLTGKAFVWIAGCITVGVFGIVSVAAFLAFVLAIPVFLAMLWYDYKTLPKKHHECALQAPARLELDGQYDFTWQVILTGVRTRRVRFFLPQPDLIRFFTDEQEVAPAKRLSDRTLFEVTVTGVCERLGRNKMLASQMRVFSQLGFWTRLFVLEPQQVIRVYPSTAAIPEQDFTQQTNRQSSLFQGSRILMRHRNADQFYSVRRYQYPDSFKTIDHKKSARYQKLMTKVYDTYQNHHLIIGLDVGRSMSGRIGASQKRDFYLSAALNLAQNAIQSGDIVSFFAFAQDIPLTIRGARSLAPFQPLHDGHDRLLVQGMESDYEMLAAGIRSISSQRCLVMVLADLTRPSVQEAILTKLPLIAQKHLTVLLSLVDKRYHVEDMLANIEPDNIRNDEYAKLVYSYWLNDQFQRFQLKAARAGSGVMVAPEKHWLDLTRKTYMLLRESLLA